jgi:hypothetical protein
MFTIASNLFLDLHRVLTICRLLCAVSVGILICHYFATLRSTLIRLIQRIRDFSSRDIGLYAAKAYHDRGNFGFRTLYGKSV